MYEYDPGERRAKHRWNNDYAGFETDEGLQVGKYPSSIDRVRAQALLNDGIRWHNPAIDSEHPQAIFAVEKGVVYKATPAIPGRSYHGFPWKGPVPRNILRQLRDVASTAGSEAEFEAWKKKHIVSARPTG